MNTYNQDTQKDDDIRPTPYDGKKAVIVGDHPLVNTVAICRYAECFPTGCVLVFEDLESNTKFAVFKPDNIKWLP